jgi:hypothetical protein
VQLKSGPIKNVFEVEAILFSVQIIFRRQATVNAAVFAQDIRAGFWYFCYALGHLAIFKA